MNAKRLSRQESRDLTREQLLDAAQKLVAEQGLAATSVEDIASEAGFSRGAFYSNFASKNDLFIEMLRRDHEKSIRDFAALFASDIPGEALRQQVRELFSHLYSDDCSFMNWTEARLLAVRDAMFRDKFAVLERETQRQITGLIEAFYKATGMVPPADGQTMALGIISLIEGMQLYMLSSPDAEPAAAHNVLALFIDALMRASFTPGAADPAP
ncbi:TetR/AcrR family transcriptional regulator [Paludibacterium yongneupense]|uniref:TetR/AcrR family transcriptional regulator n=1 Tax=Paludibacterium yongneupense TaxID=400061 RepID=UPI0003FC92AA|nr:TetR/AcrR family transcriptional regulator [Paludibacterium yongneupense]